MQEADRRRQYEGWVREYAAGLHAFAYRLCGDAVLAEDLVQETFYHTWRSMDAIRDPGRGRAWLYQTLRYRYAHWRRDSGRRVQAKISVDEMRDAPTLQGEGILATLSGQEALQKALDLLDDRYKEPFLMVFLEGKTCRETAEELEVPLGTVLSRIHRARIALRERLLGSDRTARNRGDKETEEEGGGGQRRPGFHAGGDL
jgi:RNA polymerase sigma-70 factor (ECF subfamily)